MDAPEAATSNRTCASRAPRLHCADSARRTAAGSLYHVGVPLVLLTALFGGLRAHADTVDTTGQLDITADDVRTGAYAALATAPVIAESSVGEWDASSTIVIIAPSGFRFDTGVNCVATVTEGDVTLVANSVTPLNYLTILFAIDSAGSSASKIQFTGIELRQDDTSCDPGGQVGGRAPITITTTGGTLSDTPLVSVAVVHGDPYELVYTPGSVVDTDAGENLLPEITMRDECGNTVTSDDRLITISEAGGQTVNGTTSKTTASGVVTWTAVETLNITTVGTYQLRATAGGAPFAGNTQDSSSFDILPNEPYAVGFLVQPVDTAAGEHLLPQVRVLDEHSNVVSDQVRTITLSLEVNPGGDDLHDTVVLDTVSGVAVWDAAASMHIEEAQSGYQLRATCSGAFAGGGTNWVASNAFDITHNVADHLTIAGLVDSDAGANLLPVVTLLDAYDNTVLDDDRQITLTIANDPPAPPPTTLNGTTSKATTSGVASWGAPDGLNITRSAVGFTLQAAADGAALPGGSSVESGAFTIHPLAPDHLAFVTQPADPTDAGEDLLPVVAIHDVYGNAVPGFDQAVTLTIEDDPFNPPGPATTLHGTTAKTTVDGVVTWTAVQGLNITDAAAGFTLRAQAANPGDFNDGQGNDVSAVFEIEPAEPYSVEFLMQPVDTVAGDDLLPQVRVLDEHGNVIDDQVRTITLSLEVNPGGDTLHDTIAIDTAGGVAVWNAAASLHLEEAQNGYQLRATCSGAFAGGGTNWVASAAFDITHAAAQQLAIAGPADTPAGDDLLPVLTIQDVYGNTVLDDDRQITLTIANDPLNPPPTPLTGTAVKDTSSGVATWTAIEALNITKAADGFTLQAEADGAALPAGNTVVSAAFDITCLVPDRLVFSTQPADPTGAGEDLLPVVEILDVHDNVVSGYDQNITLTIENDPAAPPPTTLFGTTVLATVDGVAAWLDGHDLNVQTMAVGYTLKAQAANPGDFNDGQGNCISDPFEITVGPPHHVGFGTPPPDTAAGADLLFTVEIQDEYDNAVAGDDRSITITIADDPFNPPGPPTPLGGTNQKSTSSGVAIWTAVEGLNITKAAAGFTLQADADGAALPGGNTAVSPAFAITSAAADHLIFSVQPSDAAAGDNLLPAVTLRDQYNNTVPGDERQITLTIANDPLVPPGPPTALNGTAQKTTTGGVASWTPAESLDIRAVADGFTLQAEAGGAALPGGSTVVSAAFNITHNVAHHLAFTTEPADTTAGQHLLPVVTLQDAYGNTVLDDDRQITLTIATDPPSPPATTLHGTAVKDTSSGVATWTAGETLNITTAANGFTLQAESNGAALPGGDTVISAAFNITHDAAHHLAFTTDPVDTAAGQDLLPVVTLQDQFDNTVPDDDRQITLTTANDPLSPPPTALNGTAVKDSTSGVATWTVIEGLNIVAAANGFTLRAQAGGAALPGGSTADSGAFDILHDVAHHLVFSTQPIDTVASQDLLPAVTIRDQYDNTVRNDERQITLTIANDPLSPPPTSLNGTALKGTSSGTATWTAVEGLNILNAAAGFTLQADADGAALPGGSSVISAAFDVTPQASADHLAFTIQPVDTTAGVALVPQVTIQDEFDNTVPTADCNITLTIENDAGAPPATTLHGTTTLATSNGVVTWTLPDDLNIRKAADGYTLKATADGVFVDPDVISAAFDIATADLEHFDVVPGAGSVLVDNPVTLTITARDAFDNPLPGWTTAQPITLLTTPGGSADDLDWNSAIPSFVDNGATATIPAGTVFDAVTATVSADVTNRVAQTITVTADDALTPASGTSSNITWTADTLTDFLLEVDDAQPTAGQVATFTLTARDQFGNPIPNYDPAADIAVQASGSISGAVAFAGTGVTDNGDNTATIDESTPGLFNGVGKATFTVTHTASAEAITFAANEGATVSNGVVVTWQAGVLDDFLLEVDDATPIAGTAATFTLTARDVFDNPILDYDPAADIQITAVGAITGNVTFAGAGLTDNGDNSATIAETTVFDGSGQTTFTINHAVSGELATVSAGEGAWTSNSVGVTWQAGILDHFLLEVDDAAPTASSPATFTLTARDAQDNPIPNYDPAADIQLTAGGAITGAVVFAGAGLTDNGDNSATIAETTVFDGSGQTTFTVNHTVSGETITVSANEGVRTSNGVVVEWVPNTPLLLVIESVNPDPPIAGSNFTVTVRVTDLYGNYSGVAGDTGIELRLSVGSGTLVAGPETIGAGTYTAVFDPVTYDIAEQIVLAVDRTSGDTLVSGTLGPFEVSGATATTLTVDDIGVQEAGVPFDVTVRARDDYGNPASVSADTDIALDLIQGNGALSGVATGQIANGQKEVTISGVVCQASQTQAIIRAQDNNPGVLSPALSNEFIVGPAPANKLGFEPIPQPYANIAFDVTVDVLDQYGNSAPATGPSNVTLALATGTGTLTFIGPQMLPLSAGDRSVTFTVKYDTAEDGVSLDATDSGALLPATSAVFSVSPSLPVRLEIDPLAATLTAGELFDVTVRAVDSAGNDANVSSDTVVLLDVNHGSGALSRAGELPLSGTIAASSNTVTITNVSYDTAEPDVVLVTTVDSGDDLAPGLSNAFDVVPAAAAGLRFVQQPTNTDLSTAVMVAIEISDALGNRVPTASDPVTLTLLAPGGCGSALNGTTTVAAVNGLAEFTPAENVLVGSVCTNYRLRASAAGLGSVDSDAFNVGAGRNIGSAGLELSVGAGRAELAVTYTITGAETIDPFLIAYGLERDADNGQPIDTIFGYLDVVDSARRVPGVHHVALGDVRPDLDGVARDGDRIVVVLDADDEVTETSESDNTATTVIDVDVELRSLVVALQGGGSHVRLVYAVNSPADVPPFVIQIGLDCDRDGVGEDVLATLNGTDVDNTPGSHVCTVSLSGELLARSIINDPSITIVAVLDVTDQVVESDEDNNRRSTTEQGYVELVVHLESYPDRIVPGEQLPCVWRISNAGNIDALDVVLTVPIPADTEFVRAEWLPAGDAGETAAALPPFAEPEVWLQDGSAFVQVGTLAPGQTRDVLIVLESLAAGQFDLWAELSTDSNTVRSAITPAGSGPDGYWDPNEILVEETTTTTHFVGLCGGLSLPLMLITLLGVLGLKKTRIGLPQCEAKHMHRRNRSPGIGERPPGW